MSKCFNRFVLGAVAAALALLSVSTAPQPATADIVRNAPWPSPPNRSPQITVTYLASGGGGAACYGSPPSHAVGNLDTWWCYGPSNNLLGYLHARGQEFVLYRQNMTVRCRYFYVADMEQPPQRVDSDGWRGRGECAGEGPYHIEVRWPKPGR